MTNTKDVRQTLAARVRVCMVNKHVTQDSMAKYLNVSRPAVSQKVNGQIPFKVEELAQISMYFDVSSDSLLGLRPLEVR